MRKAVGDEDYDVAIDGNLFILEDYAEACEIQARAAGKRGYVWHHKWPQIAARLKPAYDEALVEQERIKRMERKPRRRTKGGA